MIREKLIFKVPIEVSDSCPIEARNFITAHNAATGSTMDTIQEDAICGLVSRLQGNDTTNDSDLWSAFVSVNSRLWTLTPINNSTANATAYNVELMTASTKGTFNNFVSGDFTPSGVTGGTSKYFLTDTFTDDYSQNLVGFGCYINSYLDTANTLRAGADSGGATVQNNLASRLTQTEAVVRVNSLPGTTPAISTGANIDREGLHIAERDSSTTVRQVTNGVEVAQGSSPTSAVPHNQLGFHAFVRSGSPINESSDRFSMYLFGLPRLTDNEQQDLYDAVQWYQANVITGGRDA